MATPTSNALDHLWSDGIAGLRAFSDRHGHPFVPREYALPTGFSLGLWVAAVADFHKHGRLTDAQRFDIEAIPGWTLIHDLRLLAPSDVTWS